LSRFICEIAAFLPYTTPDEPVVIVQTIDKIVSIKGSHLLTTLKTATTSTLPSSHTEAKQALTRLKCECTAANSIVFLLELKRFLISRYSLGARYKNLAPNEAVKGPLTDKLVSNDVNTPSLVQPFSPIVELSTTDPISSVKILYTKFKAIMKEDEAEHFPLVVAPSPTKPKRGARNTKKRKLPTADSRPKRKQKKSKVTADDDEMDDEDDDNDEEEYRPV